MRKEGQRHYSEKGGHLARGKYWKSIQKEQRLEHRKKRTEADQFSHMRFSPLVGREVLLFEPKSQVID